MLSNTHRRQLSVHPRTGRRGMPNGIHTRQMPNAHLALIWTNTKRVFGVDLAFGVDLGECQKTFIPLIS